jgi:hypothetical protein
VQLARPNLVPVAIAIDHLKADAVLGSLQSEPGGDQPIARWSSIWSRNEFRRSVCELRRRRENAMRSAEAAL